jgi:hypothetical protein
MYSSLPRDSSGEQRRAEKSREEQRRAEKSREEKSRTLT